MAVSSHEGDDDRVGRLILAGDDRGIVLLLEHFAGRVTGYLKLRFPSLDEPDIHDVVVDAVLALQATFDPQRGSLAAWFLLLAHQGAVAKLRSAGHARQESFDEDALVDHGASPLGRLIDLEQRMEVRRAIAGLPGLEQSVVQADLEAGATVSASVLAERFDTTEGSIYAARRRARTKLLGKLSWLKNATRKRADDDGETTQPE